MSVEPPASDADLAEWAAWSRLVGKGHLDPARLRDEARRSRSEPHYGLRDPAPAPDVERERPVLTVDPGPLGRDGRMLLVLALRDTAARASAGTAGDWHPVVAALGALADALSEGEGPTDVRVRANRLEREQLFKVLQAAHERARSERSPAEDALRRVLAGVELWAFGEGGWQPPRSNQPPEWDPTWSDGSGLFRGGR